MVGAEIAVSTLLQSMLQASGREAVAGVRSRLTRRPTRQHRRRTHQDLLARVTRARLRITLIRQLQSHVVRVVVPLGGVSAATLAALNDNVVDMSDVIGAWLPVRDSAKGPMIEAADEVVLALAGLLEHPDPGWLHPRRRAAARTLATAGERRFETALAEFVRLVEVDTGQTRAQRKAAKRRQST